MGIPAVVLCEGHFADASGKTAHGLVRYSDHYDIVGVIDSTLASRDAGEVLGVKVSGIKLHPCIVHVVVDQ